MYRFVGKKGKCYDFDFDSLKKVAMKLNYRCPKGKFVPDSFSCGDTPEEAKKNYESLHPERGVEKVTKSKTSTKKPSTLSSTRSRIASSEEVVIDLTKSNDKLLATIKNSKDQEEIKKLQRIVEGNNKSIEYFKNKIKLSPTQVDVTKVNDIANKVRSGKKITTKEYDVLKPLVVKNTLNIDDSNKFIKTDQYKKLCKESNKILSSRTNQQTIEYYVDDSSTINEFLIKGSILAVPSKQKAMEDRAKYYISNLEKIMNRSELKEPVNVYSGISKELYDKISSSGKEFISPAFISTSADEKVAEGFTEVRGIEELNTVDLFDNILENPKNLPKEGYMLEIKLPTGTKAIALNDFVQKSRKLSNSLNPVGENGKLMSSGSQHEILLDHGITFKIIRQEIISTTYKHENGKGKSFPIKKIVVEVVPKHK
jgi:hypothetical protein